nr:unnamed protein product [Callosobruchus chinensis]
MGLETDNIGDQRNTFSMTAAGSSESADWVTRLRSPYNPSDATAWGYQAESYKRRLQAQHNTAVRQAVNGPWYVPNHRIFEDLQVTPVTKKMKQRAVKLFANYSSKQHTTYIIYRFLMFPRNFLHKIQ